MGIAASAHEATTGVAFDAKPCEYFGPEGHDPPEEIVRARARYVELKNQHLGKAEHEKAGDALLKDVGLAVAFHDAGARPARGRIASRRRRGCE